MVFIIALILTLQIILIGFIGLLFRSIFTQDSQHTASQKITEQQLTILLERIQQLQSQRQDLQALLQQHTHDIKLQRERFDKHQIDSLKVIQDSLRDGLHGAQEHIHRTLKQHGELLSQQINQLTRETQERLKQISGEVDKQLEKGFEKTTATFTDVMKRLTIIDQAQQKITELSSNVVGLQDILNDKRSRGAFGEIQLNSLIRNVIPDGHFSLQHTLSNGKRADCLLLLPDPTGNIAIDAKFPLESFKQLQASNLPVQQQNAYEQQFRNDIKKHIQDIASKYIIPDETSDGAMMFIPAEAVFAEIHAHYPELIELAQKSRVWLVSPTTMMAVLTTARAVLKDAATRKQVHIIQQHLNALGTDFGRFQTRMDNLAKHINQAQQDVEQVHVSSKKISSRFNKIEQVELNTESDETISLT